MDASDLEFSECMWLLVMMYWEFFFFYFMTATMSSVVREWTQGDQKYTVSCTSVEETALLMSGVRGRTGQTGWRPQTSSEQASRKQGELCEVAGECTSFVDSDVGPILVRLLSGIFVFC